MKKRRPQPQDGNNGRQRVVTPGEIAFDASLEPVVAALRKKCSDFVLICGHDQAQVCLGFHKGIKTQALVANLITSDEGFRRIFSGALHMLFQAMQR